jgi:hypothetical protein
MPTTSARTLLSQFDKHTVIGQLKKEDAQMKYVTLAVFFATTFLATVAAAQSNNPPLNVTVTNTPLPVSVVAPPSAPTIVCTRLLLSGGGPGQFTGGGGSSAFVGAALKCPAGVTAIDVKRVVIEPVNSPNVTGYITTVKNGPPDPLNSFDVTEPKLLAVVTNGAPEVSLDDPVRLDVSPTSTLRLVVRTSCSSQISRGIDCSSTLYLFGRAVQ